LKIKRLVFDLHKYTGEIVRGAVEGVLSEYRSPILELETQIKNEIEKGIEDFNLNYQFSSAEPLEDLSNDFTYSETFSDETDFSECVVKDTLKDNREINNND